MQLIKRRNEGGIAPPCASIFFNGNEAKTRARDLKDASFPTASTST